MYIAIMSAEQTQGKEKVCANTQNNYMKTNGYGIARTKCGCQQTNERKKMVLRLNCSKISLKKKLRQIAFDTL